MINRLQFINTSEPPTPDEGTTFIYIDSATKRLCTKDDAGVVTEYCPCPAEALTTMRVAGSGTAAVHGDYTERGEYGGRPYYNLIGQPDSPGQSAISRPSTHWTIRTAGNGNAFISSEDVATPDLVQTWVADEDGTDPVPTVTLVT